MRGVREMGTLKGRYADMKLNIQKKLSEYFLYFMLYSIIGWIYEVFLEVFVYRWGFSNRGVLSALTVSYTESGRSYSSSVCGS